MRSTHTLAALVVLLAVVVGCKRKGAWDRDTDPASPDAKTTARPAPPVIHMPSVVTGTRPPAAEPLITQVPLPFVPPRGGGTTTAEGALLVRALDDAADDLMTRGKTPFSETGEINKNARLAYERIEKVFPALSKRPVEWQEREARTDATATAYEPAGDASKDRAVIDAQFVRLYAAMQHLREQKRRWEIEWTERISARVGHGLKPDELRREMERTIPPGRAVPLNSGNISALETTQWDWLEIDLTRRASVKWDGSHGLWGKGRLQIGEKLTMGVFGPVVLALSGNVGVALELNGGPAVIDLTELNCPFVRVHTDWAVVRAGPGIGRIQLDTQSGLVLGRGAPRLKVAMRPRNPVAVIGY